MVWFDLISENRTSMHHPHVHQSNWSHDGWCVFHMFICLIKNAHWSNDLLWSFTVYCFVHSVHFIFDCVECTGKLLTSSQWLDLWSLGFLRSVDLIFWTLPKSKSSWKPKDRRRVAYRSCLAFGESKASNLKVIKKSLNKQHLKLVFIWSVHGIIAILEFES